MWMELANRFQHGDGFIYFMLVLAFFGLVILFERIIMLQFVFESVLLCLAGGLIGIAVGALTAANAGRFLNDITPSVSMSSVILAVGVSTLVGLVFGIYPAAKAARLNPIDALRYE